MNPDDELPRIGHSAVDPAAVSGEGEAFAELAARLGVEPIEAQVSEGWRVLRQRGDEAVVGAPLDAERTSWWVAYLRPGEEVWFVDSPERLRASHAERRRGLALRWPSVARPDAGPDGFVIDVVNTGSQRWEPDGDSFQVVGSVTGAHESRVLMTWAASGGMPAVPLDPGEYARVPVDIDEDAWAAVVPGENTLHAWLVPLRVVAEPLQIQVSAESVKDAQANERWEGSDQNRAALAADLLEQRAILDAGPRLPEIASAIAGTTTEEDAAAAIESLLGVGASAAEAVFRRASLSDLHVSSAEWRRERIAYTEQKLAE
ncbi:hypothetical protein SAMN05216488_1491 [Microbacterium sp. LKL04]|uniref:hypothetical protein n=1 Tax=Microbacterium sp. LKL04 TaxID=912630 RepID=UPI000875C5A1|nr:hypothetical protein [Microbacterium sp. LKL04]SCY35287.1 hypothetical protein SAMN05216488_1491 [Microbacterium sp. LKL04]